jgi:LmbE family N-acetylglucosaminyl deacetylase
MIKRGLRFVLKRTYLGLVPKGTRNAISAQLMLVEKTRAPKQLTSFDAGPVLIIAPHFDDEIAGCGGVMALHHKAGAKVSVLFTTDGCRGDPTLRDSGLSGDALRARETALTKLRKAESVAACAQVGIDDLQFLDGPDGSLSATPDLVTRLADVLTELKPQIIYHPSLLDAHSDHWATNLILDAALKQSGHSAVLRGYEVWTPAAVNLIADITQVQDIKSRAFACFPSQNATINYPRALAGLNSYRAIYFQGGAGFAEAFQELDPARFTTLIEAINARDDAHSLHT